MSEENTTIKLFDKHADKYDKMQIALVPHYEEIVAAVAEAYQHYVDQGVFLDLGCGTGNISLDILTDSPTSKVFLLDGSASMLNIAKDKIESGFGTDSIIGSKVVNLEEKTWYDGVHKPLDAVVTAFVLEHLKEPDYKSVIKKCYEYLRPKGFFISVEWSDDAYGMKEWFFAKMGKKGNSHSEYKDIVEEAIEKERHYFVNIDTKLDWIKKTGFKNVHTIWQNLFGYIVVSEK